eukprot:2013659-Pyramimonas_sp.AAC.1
MIDYALVNEQGQKLIEGVEAVYDAPWKPHIGLKFTLYTEAQETRTRSLRMPQPFPHPPRPKKQPCPGSKRTRRR